MLTDYEQMLVSALRYALGRRTYIVEITVNFIISELHSLSDYCKNIMVRDIETAHSYGDECDKEDWIRLLEALESHVDNNGNRYILCKRCGEIEVCYLKMNEECPLGKRKAVQNNGREIDNDIL